MATKFESNSKNTDDTDVVEPILKPLDSQESEVDEKSPNFIHKFKDRIDNYERPQKVNAEEILYRWDNTYDRRQALKKKTRQPKVIASTIALVCTLTGVGMIGSTALGANDYKSKISSYQQQISDLKSQEASLSSQTKQVPTTQQGAQVLNSVLSIGNKIADVQNKYESIGTDGKKLDAAANDLQKYYAQIGMAGISPWFNIDKTATNNKQYHNVKFTWKMQNPYQFLNSGTTVPMVWLCINNANGHLLAWSMANYETSTKNIDGYVYGLTQEGNAMVGASDQ